MLVTNFYIDYVELVNKDTIVIPTSGFCQQTICLAPLEAFSTALLHNQPAQRISGSSSLLSISQNLLLLLCSFTNKNQFVQSIFSFRTL